jgi:hypothetical protein
VAVKKSTTKRVVKKASKKAPAKKKAVAKKSVAKKSTAKKRVTKKAVAKKRVAKKSAVKKTAKRTTKKVAKKSSAKKSSAKKSSASTFVVPPVPRAGISASSRVNVSTTPAPAKSTSTAKPTVAPKQGTSKTVLGAVVVGVILLAIIVWSQSGSGNDDAAMPTPAASAEATPEASAEPTAEVTATEEAAVPVAEVEAPSKFVALKSAEGLTLRWVAPTATDGLTGYNVEIRANGKGDWNVIATVPADQLTQSVTKSDATGWTQFRVTSVYSDGQTASATVFGIPGVFA